MQRPNPLHLTVPAGHAGQRLDAVLADLCPDWSRTMLQRLIAQGQVQVNGVVAVRARERVQAGDQLALTPPVPTSTQAAAQEVRFRVALEDPELLVIDKPAGVVVHPGAGNPDRTLVNGLLARFPELAALPRAGLIHRLDKDTSGLLLVARTQRSFLRLVAQMAAREIHRTYLALVHGAPAASGTVEAAIGRDRVQRLRMRVTGGGRAAVTHYRVLQQFAHHAWLEVVLETGRTHQIRVHMQFLGHPLVGDPLYARSRPPPSDLPTAARAQLAGFRRQALHATRLAFSHPIDSREITVTRPPPADLRRLLAALAGPEDHDGP